MLTIGGVAGIGSTQVPAPVGLAVIAVAAVVAGALLIRLSFRRRRPVGSR